MIYIFKNFIDDPNRRKIDISMSIKTVTPYDYQDISHNLKGYNLGWWFKETQFGHIMKGFNPGTRI